jgi:hypothetical protein
MYQTVLIQFIEQLKDELRTIDRMIADLERLRAVAAGQPRRGRPPGRQRMAFSTQNNARSGIKP